MNENFAALVTSWYTQNKRDLPWRENREPYRVWLSETMLQQTRVSAAIPYYLRFLAELPTIDALANVSETQLLKLWEGLGYYSRAKNLHKAAGIIIREHGGVFPREYDEILRLPGIGLYTAGAIASICFDLPTPAVDGNVLRVMARVTADRRELSLPAVKKDYTAALAKIYPKTNPGDLTQGLMELGATVCLPGGSPDCAICPVSGLCKAYADGLTGKIPVAGSKKARRREAITVLILICGEKLAIRRREQSGLLSGMWEFPNQSGLLSADQAFALADGWAAAPARVVKSADKTHIFTHIQWDMRFYLIECRCTPPEFVWANEKELRETYAIPSAFRLSGFTHLLP
ncbi:MAG: A/G-specific adenine glycosylase [Oscillospiraceae bacterium]|nr:A/G-specific adenine glycosylase [Oscillospiraceae bacterium]